MENWICNEALSQYFHCSYTGITTDSELFCTAITQVGSTSTEKGPWGPGGWQIGCEL